ncbi:3-keto-5-aminohexanoate cleavage protein [Microbacterium sp. NPDC077644]|uniref:3-keto-5-aminohexanoate cleavage protein n=1 Tax=Microbacterium sp. NPDC077644 TaxID=3155055 RepID=UPI00344F8D65
MNELSPLVISAAVTPLRLGKPMQSAEEMVTEALASLEAGATIIHHHHNYLLSSKDASEQIIDVERQIRSEFPHALLYVDYLDGTTTPERTAYLQPLSDANLLSMFAFDPGYTMFDKLDDDGLPSQFNLQGFTFTDAAELLSFGHKAGVPVNIGIYEPGHLRWAVAYARAGKLPAGSMFKLYFPVGRGLSGKPRVGVGLYPTKQALDVYLSMMDGLEIAWEVAVPGGNVLEEPVGRYALERGGHVRVGIEDIGIERPEGILDISNADTVRAAAALADEVGRPIARPEEALQTLSNPSRVTT